MAVFIYDDFLLKSETAKNIYHRYAEKLPIIDYHCHVSPRDIFENRQYSNITELWLSGDHYKWRAMRSAGIDEHFITGDASDYEKFRAYAKIMPSLFGNPLYHWTHLELKRYFNCDLLLSSETCDEIWNITAEKLAYPSMSVRELIRQSNVKLLCTTDDPADDLIYHQKLRDDSCFDVKVLPAFRPDKAMNINKNGLKEYLIRLGKTSGISIIDLPSLKEALLRRLDAFEAFGCRTADHGLDEYSVFIKPNYYSADLIFKKALAGDPINEEELALFKGELFTFLAQEYTSRKWVMQLHTGVNRNVNSRTFADLGPDTGFDTIGDSVKISDIGQLLDFMDSKKALPRTVIYSIDPSNNAAVAALTGCFQTSGDGMPKVTQGSAWWFSDTLDGMRAQMKSFANLSVFGNFLGMLTDSRSFTSYTRHEYFRRILCEIIGEAVDNGMYPPDEKAISNLISDICFHNANRFFEFGLDCL